MRFSGGASNRLRLVGNGYEQYDLDSLGLRLDNRKVKPLATPEQVLKQPICLKILRLRRRDRTQASNCVWLELIGKCNVVVSELPEKVWHRNENDWQAPNH